MNEFVSRTLFFVRKNRKAFEKDKNKTKQIGLGS